MQADEARQHCIHHEGGDAEEDDGVGHRQRVQHIQFIVHALCRGLISACVGPAVPISRQQLVYRADDRLCVHPGGQVQAVVVEGTIQIVSRGDGSVVHPEDPEPLVVGQGLACTRFEDELW